MIALIALVAPQLALAARAAEVEIAPGAMARLADYRLFRFDSLRNEIRTRDLVGGSEETWLPGLGYYTRLQVDPRSRFLALQGNRSLVIDLASGAFPFTHPASQPFHFSVDQPLALWGSDFESLSNLNVLDLVDPAVEPVPLTELLPAQALAGAAPFNAYPYREAFGPAGILFVAIHLAEPSHGEAPAATRILAIDTNTASVIFQREVPIRAGQILYDSEHDAVLLIGGRTLLRLDPATGETLSLHHNLASLYHDNGWLLAAGQLVHVLGQIVRTVDALDGSDRTTVQVEGSIYATLVADDSGIVFFAVWDAIAGRWDSTGTSRLIAFDTTTSDVLARVVIDPPTYIWARSHVAVAKLPAHWRPPDLGPIPTVQATATFTSTPTPTPCRGNCQQIALADATSYPGGDVNLEFTLDFIGNLAQADVQLAADRDLGLHYRGGSKQVCSLTSPAPVRLSQSITSACAGDEPFCSIGHFMVTGSPGALPSRVSVTCQFIVGKQATPGKYVVRLSPYVQGTGTLIRQGTITVLAPLPTATPSPRATVTASPVPPPCQSCARLELVTSQVGNNGIGVIEARLRTGGRDIVALQADLTLRPGIAASTSSAWRCKGNPLLPQRAAFVERDCNGAACRSVRGMLFATSLALAPIPDATTIFTCRVAISESAAPGAAAVAVGNAIASDLGGNRIDLSAPPGVLTIRPQ